MTDQRDAMEHFIAGLAPAVLKPTFDPARVQAYIFGDLREKGSSYGTGHVWNTHDAERVLPVAWHCPDTLLVWNSKRERDGRLAYSGSLEQEQGLACLRRREGWTALSWWDRSGDPRGGCNTTIIVRGDLTFEQMLAVFEHKFPRIAARQPVPLVLCEPLEER